MTRLAGHDVFPIGLAHLRETISGARYPAATLAEIDTEEHHADAG